MDSRNPVIGHASAPEPKADAFYRLTSLTGALQTILDEFDQTVFDAGPDEPVDFCSALDPGLRGILIDQLEHGEMWAKRVVLPTEHRKAFHAACEASGIRLPTLVASVLSALRPGALMSRVTMEKARQALRELRRVAASPGLQADSPATASVGAAGGGEGDAGTKIYVENLVMGDRITAQDSTVATHSEVNASHRINRGDELNDRASESRTAFARLSENVVAQVIASIVMIAIIGVAIWQWPWIKEFLG